MTDLNKLKEVANDKSILYIDGDKVLQKNFSVYFQKTFKLFFQAFDAKEGLEVFKKNKPDIVITELDLDVIDAIEMLTDIKDIDEKVIIISLSKEDSENYELLQNLDMGLNKILLKPVNFANLASTIIDILPKPQKKKITPKKTIPKPTTIIQPKPTKTKTTNTIKKDPIQTKPTKKEPVEKVEKIDLKKIKPKEKSDLKKIDKKQVQAPQAKKQKTIESCMDDIKELCDEKTTVMVLNAYKGISIQNSAELISCDNKTLKAKVSIAQILSIKYENHAVFYIDKIKKHILAELLSIDIKNSTVKFKNPRYIPYKQRNKTYSRILVDKSFKASMYLNNTHVDFVPSYVSFNSAVFYTDNISLAIEVGSGFDITLGFDLIGPNKMISERKFTKIFAHGEVIRVDPYKEGINIIIKLDVKKAGQNVFKKYLQQRELEIVKELKKRLRS